MIWAFKAYSKYIHSSINTFYADFYTRNVIIVFLLYTILVFRKHFVFVFEINFPTRETKSNEKRAERKHI